MLWHHHHIRIACLAATAAVLMTACSSRAADVPDDWFALARRAAPGDDEMQLELDRGCELVDDFTVDGTRLALVGSGTSRYGDDQGVRYQCAWTGPDGTGHPANARLEVIALASTADVRDYRSLLAERPGGSQHESRGWQVDVAADRSAPSSGAVYDAEIVVDDERGVVRLLLELTDPQLAREWTPANVADQLTSVLGAEGD